MCAGCHVTTLKVSNVVYARRADVRLCAVGDSFIWDEEKTQEDEGCQLEDNAGQIDTTLQHYAFPLALAMHEKFFDEIFRWMASHAS